MDDFITALSWLGTDGRTLQHLTGFDTCLGDVARHQSVRWQTALETAEARAAR